MNASRLILSCEHAGNGVPARYRPLFAGNPDVLATHRAYDIGIAAVAAALQKALNCPLIRYTWTRLLIDVNRTRKTSQFSEFSSELSEADKKKLIESYYLPYRQQLQQAIARGRSSKPVLHLSLHSFTPVLKGRRRNADIGLLYDPAKKQETVFARDFQEYLRARSALRVRRNYPYLGRAEGMTTWLRRQYSSQQYWGIELEVNQSLLQALRPQTRANFVSLMAGYLQTAIEQRKG